MSLHVDSEFEECVAKALNEIHHRAVQPELYGGHPGHNFRLKTERQRKEFGGPPLKPRHRLTVRLELLVAVKKWEVALMKEILADTEAVEDAKAHKAQIPQELREGESGDYP